MSTALSQAPGPYTDEKKEALLPSAELPGYQAAEPEAPPPPSEQISRRRHRCRRFGHFLVATIFLWLTARYLFRHCELRRIGPHRLLWGSGHDEHDEPSPLHDDEIDACVDSAEWTEYDPDGEHHAPFEVWRRTELTLPSSAEDIFMIYHGFSAIGVLHVTEAADRDDIGVEVIVGLHEDSDLFDKTSVCTLRRGDNGHGIGILIPRFKHHHGHHKRDSLFFNITVSLPEAKDVTTIPHFETHMPMFAHIVKKLPTHTFGSVSLRSAHSPIIVEDLTGNKINVRSKHGPIEGTFSTSSSLDIKTSDSPIKVIVNAFNEDDAVPTKLNMRTSNGPVQAHLSLISTREDKTNGVFFVHTRTSNSPLALNFMEQPPDALLKLEAHTSNSPARVHLHPSFEGTFKLRTSIFPAFVSENDEVEDPAGRDRKRVVHVKSVGRGARIVHGDVEWVPEDEAVAPAGRVEVSTSHSPLRLLL